MKEHIELFRTSVGNVILPVALLDPSLRTSPVRGAIVVTVAVTVGILVVSVAVVHKNMTMARDFFVGNKVRA